MQLSEEAIEVSVKVIDLKELRHAQNFVQNDQELFFRRTLQGLL